MQDTFIHIFRTSLDKAISFSSPRAETQAPYLEIDWMPFLDEFVPSNHATFVLYSSRRGMKRNETAYPHTSPIIRPGTVPSCDLSFYDTRRGTCPFHTLKHIFIERKRGIGGGGHGGSRV